MKLIISLEGSTVKEVILEKDQYTIGRKSLNDIRLENLSVSGEHAIIRRANDVYLIEDLKTTNGTIVNGIQIAQHVLKDKDKIEIGNFSLQFCKEKEDRVNLENIVSLWYSLRLRIILAFLTCFIALGATGIYLLRASVLPEFNKLEKQETLNNAGRLIEGFDGVLFQLALISKDWANWDDMYNFSVKPNAEWKKNNISPAQLVNASFSVLTIITHDGKILSHDSIDPITGRSRDIGILSEKNAEFMLQVRNTKKGATCGFKKFESKILLLCWRPILKADETGESRAVFFVGRDLNESMMGKIKSQSKLDFQLDDSVNQVSKNSTEEILTAGSPVYLSDNKVQSVTDEENIYLTSTLYDFDKKPITNIKFTQKRDLLNQGINLLSTVTRQLGFGAAIFGLILLSFIQVWIVNPLAKLQKTISNTRAKKLWQFRIQTKANDEIGRLSQEFNSLLAVIDNQVKDLEILSMKDSLTGAYNRRVFNQKLSEEFKRAKRMQTPLSLLMIDIDFFKLYNDTYGHPAGDEVIKALASAMSVAAKRDSDIVARLGGEEFALLMPGTDTDGAFQIAQAVQEELAKKKILHTKSKVSEFVTTSIGLACIIDKDETEKDLVARADKALYNAKEGNRNQVFIAKD